MNSKMTNTEQQFLSILKNAVHPKPSFTMDNPDWNGIINTARKQNLFPLIFDASSSLPGYEKVETTYFDSVAAQMSKQAQQTADFLSLYQSFLEDDISPIVMKGIICRSLYGEKADFRASGDEDILIPKEDYEKAVHTLNRCGYRAENTPDSNLSSVQEVTFTNPESPLTIELHLNPFGTNDHIRVKMNEWFQNVFNSQETVVVDGVPVRTLRPTDHLLFLIFHAFKHFISGGFGVRMMLDILLFAEKYSDHIDQEYIQNGLTSVNAADFYNDLLILGNQYLGFSLPVNEDGTIPDELMEDMLRMGTFGNSSKNDSTAGRITSMAVEKDNKNHSRLTDMFWLLFPSWQFWVSWKPYLKDKPWMLPVEWVKRVVKYLRRGKPASDLMESYKVADRRLELMKKYGVI